MSIWTSYRTLAHWQPPEYVFVIACNFPRRYTSSVGEVYPSAMEADNVETLHLGIEGSCAKSRLRFLTGGALDFARAQRDHAHRSRHSTARDAAAPRARESPDQRALAHVDCCYRTLGGSFTGDLTVDPAHLKDASRLVGSLLILYFDRRKMVMGTEPSGRGATFHESSSPLIS